MRQRKWVQTMGLMGVAAGLYLTITYQISLGPLLFILSVLALLGFSTQYDEMEITHETDYSLAPVSKINRQVV